jgi:hypothetical protein
MSQPRHACTSVAGVVSETSKIADIFAAGFGPVWRAGAFSFPSCRAACVGRQGGRVGGGGLAKCMAGLPHREVLQTAAIIVCVGLREGLGVMVLFIVGL